MKVIDLELRAWRWPTVQTLAMTLAVNPRTIRRALEFLRDQYHAAIGFDRARRGYYYTEPTFRLTVPQAATASECARSSASCHRARPMGRSTDRPISGSRILTVAC
jgi:predicted DNA-binding transcriptional regulator YafY